MVGRPRVLLITNEARPGDATGQIEGYTMLAESGELGQVSVVSAREGFASRPDQAVDRVLRAIREVRPDIAVIWSPGSFPGSRPNFERLRETLGPALLLYWEGDAWGAGKPVTDAMRWWVRESAIVITPCGLPQATDLLAAGAREVRHMAQTYCHVKFRDCESHVPGGVRSARVTMIGNNLMWLPGLTGIPGSTRRAELALRLRHNVKQFDLRGSGWRRLGLHAAPLAYDLQADHIRQGALSVVWDHYPSFHDSSSDRLPIALIAGRAHVTTRHPGMVWAPSEDEGLFRVSTPKDVVAVVEDLLGDRERLTTLGLEAHSWAKNRVSHREAARYILSTVVDSVAPPPADPWQNLPGPWTRG